MFLEQPERPQLPTSQNLLQVQGSSSFTLVYTLLAKHFSRSDLFLIQNLSRPLPTPNSPSNPMYISFTNSGEFKSYHQVCVRTGGSRTSDFHKHNWSEGNPVPWSHLKYHRHLMKNTFHFTGTPSRQQTPPRCLPVSRTVDDE